MVPIGTISISNTFFVLFNLILGASRFHNHVDVKFYNKPRSLFPASSTK